MNNNNFKSQINFSTILFLTSLAGGTILFFLQMIFPDEINILIIGFFYLIIAIVLNIIMLFYLLYFFTLLPDLRTKIANQALLILSNIPIASLYIYLTFNK
ncbi:hypothetical protein ACI6PS_09720 [Flavobacterium sp. PLA-1-15]|uniref:hypothetical protein n=1 Tax=Flavobacterium sp. PLA-1-15 TaxID=3380533 RepID=UPI003B80D306